MARALGTWTLLTLLTCGLLWPQPATSHLQRPEACHACVPSEYREELAIGFHLGQSYGVSVNLLDNGTAVNLAKVPGSHLHIELIERLMATPAPPHGRLPDGISTVFTRAVKYALGISPPRDATILGELIGDRKAATEAELRRSLDGHAVPITAPWQDYWRYQGSWSSDINDALIQQGLRPWAPYTKDPVYLNEARTTLASCGRWLCQPFEPSDSGEVHRIPERVYYISVGGHAAGQHSFTNSSLYTAFTGPPPFGDAPCFHHHPIEHPGIINNRLGLDRRTHSHAPPDKFWSAVRGHLNARARDLQDWASGPAKHLVVVAGEAADRPEFLAIVGAMAEGMPSVISAPGPRQGTLGTGAELVVPEDPVSAPATGAALWSRLRLEEGSYCMVEECVPLSADVWIMGSDEKDEL